MVQWYLLKAGTTLARAVVLRYQLLGDNPDEMRYFIERRTKPPVYVRLIHASASFSVQRVYWCVTDHRSFSEKRAVTNCR